MTTAMKANPGPQTTDSTMVLRETPSSNQAPDPQSKLNDAPGVIKHSIT